MQTKILIAVCVLLAQAAAAQITFTNLGNTADPDFLTDIDQTSYSTASWTPPSSGLIVVYVNAQKASGSATPTTPTMSGNSLTWTLITGPLQCISRNGLTIFAANASGSTTGSTTVDFGGTTQTLCSTYFFKADGADLSGGVTAAFVQTPSNTGTGTSLSIGLNAAGNSSNRPVSGFWHNAFVEGSTPRANWTELDDLSGTGENIGLETQYRGDSFETTASASWTTSSGCCGIAAEIKAAAVGGSTARVIIINQ